MVKFEFESLRFIENENKIKVIFMKYFYFEIDKNEIERIGKCKIEKNSITIDNPKAEKKFNYLLEEGFNNLKHLLTKNPAFYVHRNSDIPLIGNNSFGIIDRNTNIIELKPITGCNLDCIYCSVSNCYRERDFIVEEEYIIQELKKVLDYKNCDDIEAHIGVQGEPLLYADLVRLVKDLKNLPQIKRITMDTNATLLTREMVDELIKDGITRFNVSINAIDNSSSKKIAGANYNIDHIIEIITYIAKKGSNFIHVAPVIMFGINENEIERIIELAKKLNINCWIQNYLEYSGGKKPVKQKDWQFFKEYLSKMEKKYSIKLLADFKKDFQLIETKALPQPFKNGDFIQAKIVCKGRFKDEYIVSYKDRAISFFAKNRQYTVGDMVKLKITSLKHNMAVAEAVK